VDLFEQTFLRDLRNTWRSTIETEGGTCPCCHRWGKVYARSINATMARSLIWLCHAPGAAGGWVDVPTQAPRWLVRSNQLPTLRWWDLVERATADDADKKHSGMWRPTPLGSAFAKGEVAIPKTVYTYAGEREKYGTGLIRIMDCFDSQFSYQEVMKAGGANEA
jgi:hypothetical protein